MEKRTEMTEKFAPYDTAEFLTTPGRVQAYMDEAVSSGDGATIARALGTIARARSMSEVARQAGLTRAGLHKALSGAGKPGLETIMKVSGALGLQIQFTAIGDTAVMKARAAMAKRRKVSTPVVNLDVAQKPMASGKIKIKKSPAKIASTARRSAGGAKSAGASRKRA